MKTSVLRRVVLALSRLTIAALAGGALGGCGASARQVHENRHLSGSPRPVDGPDESAMESPTVGRPAAPMHPAPDLDRPNPRLIDRWRNGADRDPTLDALLDRAEQRATPAGRKILQTGRAMIRDDEIVRGSCWTYADAVYKQAGVVRKRRRRVFKSHKNGPYADPAILQPGDFLAYINHSYGDGVHSAIFVGWLDRERVEALMMSYVGSRRSVPGGYRSYLLTSVYGVVRPRN